MDASTEALLVAEVVDAPLPAAATPSAPEPPSAADVPKPRLRGVPDVVATSIAVPAVLTLVASARPGLATFGALVYGLGLVLLFGVSATYHTPTWSPRALAVMRRLDHSAIYVLIAGTYTPVCLLVVHDYVLLAVVWAAALGGVLKSFLWSGAPRLITTGIYLALGWLLAFELPAVLAEQGVLWVALVGGGGLSYTLGAVIYARHAPDPWPTTFGYHELFHVFVIGAAVSHYVAVWRVVT